MEKKKGFLMMFIIGITILGLWIAPMSLAKEPERVVKIGDYSPVLALDPATATSSQSARGQVFTLAVPYDG